jgi:hypothetical protein
LFVTGEGLDQGRGAVDERDADAQGAQTATSSRILAKFSSVTIAPSRAMTKVFSRNRGTYWRMPRRSVGFTLDQVDWQGADRFGGKDGIQWVGEEFMPHSIEVKPDHPARRRGIVGFPRLCRH